MKAGLGIRADFGRVWAELRQHHQVGIRNNELTETAIVEKASHYDDDGHGHAGHSH
jgi:hypothetical protein